MLIIQIVAAVAAALVAPSAAKKFVNPYGPVEAAIKKSLHGCTYDFFESALNGEYWQLCNELRDDDDRDESAYDFIARLGLGEELTEACGPDSYQRFWENINRRLKDWSKACPSHPPPVRMAIAKSPYGPSRSSGGTTNIQKNVKAVISGLRLKCTKSLFARAVATPDDYVSLCSDLEHPDPNTDNAVTQFVGAIKDQCPEDVHYFKNRKNEAKFINDLKDACGHTGEDWTHEIDTIESDFDKDTKAETEIKDYARKVCKAVASVAENSLDKCFINVFNTHFRSHEKFCRSFNSLYHDIERSDFASLKKDLSNDISKLPHYKSEFARFAQLVSSTCHPGDVKARFKNQDDELEIILDFARACKTCYA